MPIDAHTINRLAAKLDTMDLDDDERAILDAILDRAADAGTEVAGFAMFEMGADQQWSVPEQGARASSQEQALKVKPLDFSLSGSRIADALGMRR